MVPSMLIPSSVDGSNHLRSTAGNKLLAKQETLRFTQHRPFRFPLQLQCLVAHRCRIQNVQSHSFSVPVRTSDFHRSCHETSSRTSVLRSITAKKSNPFIKYSFKITGLFPTLYTPHNVPTMFAQIK